MKKAFTLIEIMIVVVIIGLLAVMAVPAFNKVRTEARAKTIWANLRTVAVTGQQYMLDKAITQATYKQLVDDKRFIAFKSIAGEKYDSLMVKEGASKLVATEAGGDRIVYTYE